jgi:hypothetical protein
MNSRAARGHGGHRRSAPNEQPERDAERSRGREPASGDLEPIAAQRVTAECGLEVPGAVAGPVNAWSFGIRTSVRTGLFGPRFSIGSHGRGRSAAPAREPAPDLDMCSALGGTRTPNLLIRSHRPASAVLIDARRVSPGFSRSAVPEARRAARQAVRCSHMVERLPISSSPVHHCRRRAAPGGPTTRWRARQHGAALHPVVLRSAGSCQPAAPFLPWVAT